MARWSLPASLDTMPSTSLVKLQTSLHAPALFCHELVDLSQFADDSLKDRPLWTEVRIHLMLSMPQEP